MAKISLRAYNREIENLINGGQVDEAIAHCRHILAQFPKHVDTYRLLGKAFLESQRYGDAADIFQRVLSAVPDDFVSNVGMSIIREDEGDLDEAIWYMERAYEVQPNNNAIQDELRRLYGRRDGVEPPKIRLTRGALARMYWKGEHYTQAAAEVRAALAENQNRLDLELLLAQVNAALGKKAEAAESLNHVLRKLPYCLEANRLMSNVLRDTERAESTQAYRNRVIAMDPYAAHLPPGAVPAEQAPDEAVSLERLVYRPGVSQVGGQPEWAASLGVQVGESSVEQETVPEWLKDNEETDVQETSAEDQAFEVEAEDWRPEEGTPDESSAELAAGEDIPTWMRDAGWGPSSGEVEEGHLDFGESDFELEAEDLSPAELPDWLKDIAPQDQVEVSPEELAQAEADLSWLEDARQTESPEESGPQEEQADPSELPDWLSEESYGSEDESQGEVPDWLKGLTAAAGAAGLAALASSESETEETEPPAAEAEPEAEIAEAGEVPDWLAEFKDDVDSPGAALEPQEDFSEEIPDWLAEFTAEVQALRNEEPAEAEALFEQEELEIQAVEEEESETMISDLEVEQPAIDEDETDAAFAWLESLAVKQGASEALLLDEDERIETPPDWVQKAAAQEFDQSVLESIEAEEQPILEPAGEPEASGDLGDEETSEEDTQPVQVAPAEQEEAVEPLSSELQEEEIEEEEQAVQVTQPVGEQELHAEEAEKLPEEESEPTFDLEDDAAFAWLESLAVKQGASEALLLDEEERREAPPEWVQQAKEEEEPESIIKVAAAAAAAAALFKTEDVEEPEQELEAPVVPEIPVKGEEEEEPASEVVEPVDLETLEQTEAEAEEQTLPEPPDWVLEAEQEAETAGEVEEEPLPDLPDWLVEESPEEREEERWLLTGRPYLPMTEGFVPVNINEASMAELERVPGIGFILAQSIVSHRDQHGPFRSVDELINVAGINVATLEYIRLRVVVPVEPEPEPEAERKPEAELEPVQKLEREAPADRPAELVAAYQAIFDQGGQPAAGLYMPLIKERRYLPEIIQDLEGALEKRPDDLHLWQAIGDAYMRSDRIQDALDAYTQAEKLLR